MIPVAANIPLAICSVVIRRFIDSYTGRLPLAVAVSTVPSASTVALFSGALLCLYHQMKKGTLVNIGIGRRLSSVIKNSRNTIQRRVKNNSWFLRNVAACRRKCTEAMLRIARQSNDSMQNIKAETGTVVQTNSLPVFTRHIDTEHHRKAQRLKEPSVENLYSNESFESQDCSNQDLRVATPRPKSFISNSRRRREADTFNRPVTRNFRKCIPENSCEDSRNRKRKKSEHIVNESEDQPTLLTRSRSDVRKQLPRKQLRRISEEISDGQQVSTKSSAVRRSSERIKKQPKVQKITRKTRSGRVYAYRL